MRSATSSATEGGERASVSVSSRTHSSSESNGFSCHNGVIMKSKVSKRIHRAVLVGRLAFVAALLAVAAVTGCLLFWYLSTNEKALAEKQFDAIAKRALQAASGVVTRKRLSMVTMSVMMSEQLRNLGDWPLNAYVPGYDRIVRQLAATGSHTNMGFAPIVPVQDQDAWEDFAYQYFDSREDFPNTTGVNRFGKGIWRMERSLNSNGTTTRIHDNDEQTLQRKILTPIFQCCIDNPGDKILMFNLHSDPKRRKPIDAIRNCTNNILMSLNNNKSKVEDYPDYSCGSMTDFVNIFRFKHRGPASIFFHPIWPAEDPFNITGIMLSPIVWDEIFENVFNVDMDGVHCVLESETEVHTYIITKGLVETFAKGDLHDPKYDDLGKSVDLTMHELHATGVCPMYRLSLYPTDDFIRLKSTTNPRNATIVAVSVVVFVSFLFLLYDYMVRQEFLERKNLLDAKRKFIRYVSHEVRTPLNAVVMGLSVLRAECSDDTTIMEAAVGISRGGDRDGEDEEVDNAIAAAAKAVDRAELVEDLQTNALNAVEVLNDVLNYDKIERSSLKLEVTIVPIWQTIERTLSEFKLPAAKKQVHLKIIYHHCKTDNKNDIENQITSDGGNAVSRVNDLPQELQDLRVAGDTARLAQVFRNLLSNALKFTPEQGLIIVNVSTHPLSTGPEKEFSDRKAKLIELHNGDSTKAIPMGHIQLSVKDSGAGMTKSQLERLFGEGVQFNVNALQGGQGSGLGLYITKGLVQQHNGTLEVASEGLGKGATFTMRLPIFHVPDLKLLERKQQPPAPDDDDASGSEKLRLLVVDDALSNRKLLSRLLLRKGHICDIAKNGQEAVQMVENNMKQNDRYDSILMDYEMPVMDGPTAAKEIRRMGCDVFIVGITGNMLNEDVEYYLSRGANAVLPKPLQMSVLENVWVEYGVITPNK